MLINKVPAEITDELLMLGTSEYPLYLVRGKSQSIVFEGGTSSMGPVLEEQLGRLGIDKSSIRLVVITHAHPDHVMAVPLFRQMLPDITVISSEAAARTLASSKALSFFCQVDEALSGSLAKAGIIADKQQAPPCTVEEITIDRTVKEGDTITVEPGVAFEVLETPGHSDCSLSFHEPGRQILLISDATGYYMPEHECWWPNYFTDYEAYVASMERLAGLGAETLCLSHNGVIRGAADVKTYFEGAIASTRALHERIVSEARAGRGVREIAEELGAEVHAKSALLPLEFFQKNCGLLVKNSLRYAGIDVKKPS